MKNLSRKLSKFRSLSIIEKIFFFEVGLISVLMSVFLKILPFNLFRFLYNIFLKFPLIFISDTRNHRLVNFTSIWGNLLHITCLPQALIVKFFFRKSTQTHLIIGVNNLAGDFNAHAWVEQNGDYLIGDRPFEQYTPLWRWQ